MKETPKSFCYQISNLVIFIKRIFANSKYNLLWLLTIAFTVRTCGRVA